MPSRKIEDLHPVVADIAAEFLQQCEDSGIHVILTATLRTFAEQDDLYAQGRTKPGKIITNAKGGDSMHNYGIAFDCAPVVDGQAVWNDMDLWEKIAAIGEALGLVWGGRWKMRDLPHFQHTAGQTLEQIRRKYANHQDYFTDSGR